MERASDARRSGQVLRMLRVQFEQFEVQLKVLKRSEYVPWRVRTKSFVFVKVNGCELAWCNGASTKVHIDLKFEYRSVYIGFLVV